MVAGCGILVFLPNGKIHRQYGLDLYFNLHLPNRARRIVHGRRHQDEEIRKLVKQGRLNAVLFIVLLAVNEIKINNHLFASWTAIFKLLFIDVQHYGHKTASRVRYGKDNGLFQ